MANWNVMRGTRLRELDKKQALSSVFPALEFSIDPRDLRSLAAKLAEFPGAFQAASLHAVDRTRQRARNELVRSYKNLLTLKPAYIGRGIKGKKARMDGGGAVAEIRIATGNIPLGRYEISPETPPAYAGVPVRQRIRVRYRLRKSGPDYGDTPKSAKAGQGNRLFVAKMDSGHVGAFSRAGKKPYGIVQDWAPSLQYHAKADGFMEHIEEFTQTRLKAAFIEEAGKIAGVGA